VSGARWLTSLVRARQLQEDAARQRLATAERIKQRANARVRYDEERLESLRDVQAESSAPVFVAAAVALQAAAAEQVRLSRAAQRELDEIAARVQRDVTAPGAHGGER
jgi:hypothetical protein